MRCRGSGSGVPGLPNSCNPVSPMHPFTNKGTLFRLFSSMKGLGFRLFSVLQQEKVIVVGHCWGTAGLRRSWACQSLQPLAVSSALECCLAMESGAMSIEGTDRSTSSLSCPWPRGLPIIEAAIEP